jgi:hypothetical protein
MSAIIHCRNTNPLELAASRPGELSRLGLLHTACNATTRCPYARTDIHISIRLSFQASNPLNRSVSETAVFDTASWHIS